jgi:TatD DNase family protein
MSDKKPYKLGKCLKDAAPDAKPLITYEIRNSLYLNITTECTNACYFCVRFQTDLVKGYNLHIDYQPTQEEILKAIGDPTRYRSIVFCGYGEPTLRLDIIKAVCQFVKQHGSYVRLVTNGHGNLIHGRNIVPELKGLVDMVDVSLNAENAELYEKICHPLYGPETYEKVKEFIRECVKYIPTVEATVVGVKEINIDKCKEIALELGAQFRFRGLDDVG